MPNTASYADVVRDWEHLLSATADNASEVPSAEPYRTELEKIMTDVKALKARQDTMAGFRQRSTQQLKEMLVQGREVAMRLRGVVKANLGPKNELLTRFGVAPLRPHGRRSKTPTEVKPPATPAPGTTPEADAKPTTP